MSTATVAMLRLAGLLSGLLAGPGPSAAATVVTARGGQRTRTQHTATATAFGPGTAYDPKIAKTLMHFSNAAYCDVPSISTWNCSECLFADTSFTAKLFLDHPTSTQAFVGITHSAAVNYIVVAFRGTTDLENWITNLNFPKTTKYAADGCIDCQVHEGFYAAWKSVKSAIITEVTRLQAANPKAHVYITGHSLGGALAVLSAAEFATLGRPPIAVYTFGEPRVGNANFAAYYKAANNESVSWRVTHWQDPVPHLPLQMMGFTHVSTEVFYNENSTDYRVCDGSGEDKSCSNNFPYEDSIPDHLDYLAWPCCCPLSQPGPDVHWRP